MTYLGLSPSELKAYSVLRALRAVAFPQNSEYQKQAAFEMDVSTEVSKKEDRSISGIILPSDVTHEKRIPNRLVNQRILTAGTDSAGGHTIEDELQRSIIDIFMEVNFAVRNVRVFPDLIGNVDIPKQVNRTVADSPVQVTLTTAEYDTNASPAANKWNVKDNTTVKFGGNTEDDAALAKLQAVPGRKIYVYIRRVRLSKPHLWLRAGLGRLRIKS